LATATRTADPTIQNSNKSTDRTPVKRSKVPKTTQACFSEAKPRRELNVNPASTFETWTRELLKIEAQTETYQNSSKETNEKPAIPDSTKQEPNSGMVQASAPISKKGFVSGSGDNSFTGNESAPQPRSDRSYQPPNNGNSSLKQVEAEKEEKGVKSNRENFKLELTPLCQPSYNPARPSDSSISTASSTKGKLKIRGLKHFKESRVCGTPPLWV
jgi:hypothetical protein